MEHGKLFLRCISKGMYITVYQISREASKGYLEVF